jgi:hypothetical protein
VDTRRWSLASLAARSLDEIRINRPIAPST